MTVSQKLPLGVQLWLDTYYPITADRMYGVIGNNNLLLLQAAIRKWKGLDEETLAAHGIRRSRYKLMYTHAKTGKSCTLLKINCSSCTLCQAYVYAVAYETNECVECPLYQIRDNTRCDERNSTVCDDDYYAPYEKWLDTGETEAMLKYLTQAYSKALKAATHTSNS